MFYFDDNEEKLAYLFFNKVAKEGGGVWLKKGHYFNGWKNASGLYCGDQEEAKKFFGVDFNPDNQKLVLIHATMSWADYGSRSKIPLLYAFVVDEIGVVRKYKVNGHGNLKDGWAPAPEKCKLEFERDSDVIVPPWLDLIFDEDRKKRELKEAGEAARAALPMLKEGRQDIEGTVLATKEVFTDFGLSLKMMIELDDGNRLYGTVPSSIEVHKGDRVRFKARVTPKEPGFSFFSRPTKAEVVVKANEEE